MQEWLGVSACAINIILRQTERILELALMFVFFLYLLHAFGRLDNGEVCVLPFSLCPTL